VASLLVVFGAGATTASDPGAETCCTVPSSDAGTGAESLPKAAFSMAATTLVGSAVGSAVGTAVTNAVAVGALVGSELGTGAVGAALDA
jgi:hypothetical protein